MLLLKTIIIKILVSNIRGKYKKKSVYLQAKWIKNNILNIYLLFIRKSKNSFIYYLDNILIIAFVI